MFYEKNNNIHDQNLINEPELTPLSCGLKPDIEEDLGKCNFLHWKTRPKVASNGAGNSNSGFKPNSPHMESD